MARDLAVVRVAGCRRRPAALDDAQLFGQSRRLRIKQLLGLNGSTGSLRSRRSRRYSDALIFMAFRGPQAQVNQLRNRPVPRASLINHR
jgi:hypothetical protein